VEHSGNESEIHKPLNHETSATGLIQQNFLFRSPTFSSLDKFGRDKMLDGFQIRKTGKITITDSNRLIESKDSLIREICF
jgi:hypothetical protein